MKFYRYCENTLLMLIIRLDLPGDSCESHTFWFTSSPPFCEGKSRYSKGASHHPSAFLRNRQGRNYTVHKER